MEIWFVITSYLSVYSGLLPLIFFIPYIFKFKTLSPVLKVLFFYCLYSILNEGWSELTNHKPNFYVANIYTYVECISIAVIYYKISDNKANFLWLCIFIAVFTIFFMLSCFFWGNINGVQNILMTFEAIFIIVLSIIFFFRLINNSQVTELTDYYFFWMNTAFLVYFSGSLAVFLFLKYIQRTNPTDIMKGLWMVHLFFNIVYNILLSKSIYTWKKNRI